MGRKALFLPHDVKCEEKKFMQRKETLSHLEMLPCPGRQSFQVTLDLLKPSQYT